MIQATIRRQCAAELGLSETTTVSEDDGSDWTGVVISIELRDRLITILEGEKP